MADVNFGECPVCRQGELFAAKEAATGALFLVCDDCESQWSSPEQARSYENALMKEVPGLRPASREEIGMAGWATT